MTKKDVIRNVGEQKEIFSQKVRRKSGNNLPNFSETFPPSRIPAYATANLTLLVERLDDEGEDYSPVLICRGWEKEVATLQTHGNLCGLS